MVDMDDRPSQPASAEPAKGGMFPMTSPNYITTINTEPIIKKLRTVNGTPELVLDDAQLSLLELPTSGDWWRLVMRIATTWPTSKSWPVMDILRARIVEPDARSVIVPEELVTLVAHIAQTPDNDDFAVLTLTRIVGNMFANYAAEATGGISIQQIFGSLSYRCAQFSPRTQLSLCNAVMNYSACLGQSAGEAAQLMETVLEIMPSDLDEESLYRVLYAAGNCAVFSSAAKERITLRPDLIDEKQSGKPTPKILRLLAGLVALLGQ